MSNENKFAVCNQGMSTVAVVKANSFVLDKDGIMFKDENGKYVAYFSKGIVQHVIQLGVIEGVK